MSFKDVIKNSIWEGFNSDISTGEVLVALGFALILGVYIFFVYRYKSKTSFYSKDFNNVLAGLPLITAGIVLAMQSSLVISLGMVGALSIVRFRNAVKNSLDLLFLFWSISIGIICGAGIFEIALIVSLIVTLLLIGMDYIPSRKSSVLLIINAEKVETLNEINALLKQIASYYKIKSRSVSQNIVDMIVEIKCKDEQLLLERCGEIQGIKNVSILTHDGELRF